MEASKALTYETTNAIAYRWFFIGFTLANAFWFTAMWSSIFPATH